ncbi:MAG: hypothetical protein O9327_05475 [Polaromonas sp.]|nr:hypothetical protein [Polaromonas sp.]
MTTYSEEATAKKTNRKTSYAKKAGARPAFASGSLRISRQP